MNLTGPEKSDLIKYLKSYSLSENRNEEGAWQAPRVFIPMLIPFPIALNQSFIYSAKRKPERVLAALRGFEESISVARCSVSLADHLLSVTLDPYRV